MVTMATTNHVQTTTTRPHSYRPIAAESRRECPLCGSSVFRIRRTSLDRLLSMVTPVQRFKCQAEKANFHCTWEGTLSANNIPAKSIPAKSTPPESIENAPVADADMSFDDMAQITLDAIGDAVLVVNPRGQVIYLNNVAETMTGWSRKLALGRSVEDVFPVVDRVSRQHRVPPSHRAINENRIVELALGSELIRRDGTGIAIEDSAAPVRNRRGEIVGAVIVFHDADQSQTEIQKMIHMAQHDSLTGLPNRSLLAERLSQAIGMAKRHHKQLALLFVDVDRFKLINDTHGHTTGDQLLQDIAANIVACVRETDTVSRHGGDEFVILLPQIEDAHDPVLIAEKLRARFAQPRLVAGHIMSVSLSIGISVFPEDGTDADALLQKADTAMYISKDNNRAQYKTGTLTSRVTYAIPAAPADELLPAATPDTLQNGTLQD